MENKYYTPTLEEFYVGFRFEMIDMCSIDGGPNMLQWNKKVLDTLSTPNAFNIDYAFRNKEIRVKYLDKSDIEELSWRMVKDYSDEFIFQTQIFTDKTKQDYWWELNFNKQSKKITIEYWTGDCCGSNFEILFQGTIKNYNELQTLMYQLNILKDER